MTTNHDDEKPVGRRDFLRAIAAGSGLAALGGCFMGGSGEAGAPGAARAAAEADAGLLPIAQRFGIGADEIRRAMTAALSKGGDYCDLYFQHTTSNALSLEDDAVNRARTSVYLGVGVRVLKGDAQGYAFTEELTPESLLRAARTAAEIASGAQGPLPQRFDLKGHPSYYPDVAGLSSVEVAKKIALMKDVDARLKAADARIVKTSVSYQDDETEVMVCTSEGVVRHDVQPMTRLWANCVAEQGGRRETGSYNVSARDAWGFYSADRIDRLVREAVRRTVLMFEAEQPKGGELPVVLGAGASGILLHEAIGHGMEADFNRKGTSTFSDRIGQKIAQPFVSIADDATIACARGSINVDDEGTPTEKTLLVEGGVLASYLHDKISAKHYGVKPTGSGRRESFRHVPMPRMRSTYMLPGPHERDEVIASVKHGIYCESFSNGQVNIGAGDFTFFVKTGFMIEDGKLGRPIKDVNLIGNGPDVLAKITMVAKDLEYDEGGWTCGKNGQGVPVSLGMPTVKVSAITVGGRA
ncbi:MAG TPA: TldD/PmbA family protein [Planctomycetota bacterium]|nr:TldD/PmbA family protein [Planctomycetota bacterium]